MLKLFSIRPAALFFPLFFLTFIGLGFLLQSVGYIQSCQGSLIPLNPAGLPGIFSSVFLHGSWEHLINNSIPLAVMLFLVFQFYPQLSGRIFIWAWLGTSCLVWLLPPFNFHTGLRDAACIIGASGMVYFLAFFLFFSGVFRGTQNLLVVSLLVALYYGSMVWGMLPEELFKNVPGGSKVSWQSHLAGGILGSVIAFAYRKSFLEKKKFIWEYPNYYSEKDDVLWQKYLENHPEIEHHAQEKPSKKENIWDRLDELDI